MQLGFGLYRNPCKRYPLGGCYIPAWIYLKVISCGFAVMFSFHSSVVWGQTADEARELYRQSFNKRLPFQTTVEMAERSLYIATNLGDSNLLKHVHMQLGVLYWNDGQFHQSINHLTRARQFAVKLLDSRMVAQSMHYQGLNYYYRCQFDSALNLYERAESIYQNQKSDSAIAKVKSHKGLIYNAIGLYNLAVQNMMDSYQLQEKTPDYRDQSILVQFPTQADERLYFEGKLNKDLESFTFLNNAKDKNKEKLAFTLHNIGKDYYHLNQYNKAIRYFLQSARYYNDLGYLPFTGDLASAYAAIDKYDSAEYWYKSRLRDVQANGTRIHLSNLYSDLGNFYKKQNRLNEALGYFTKAKDLYGQMGFVRATANTGKAITQVYGMLNQPNKALEEINESLKISNGIKCIKDTRDFLDVKAQVLHALNRDAEAFDVMRTSKTITDTIANGERQIHIASIQIQYDTEKKIRDLAEVSLKNSLREAEIEERNLLLLISFITLASVLTMLIFLFFRYLQKAKVSKILTKNTRIISEQNQLLHQQAHQREALLHEIHHRVRNNLQIISSLINLKSIQTYDDESRELLNQLNGRIFSMGLLHEKLYKNENLRSIRLDLYLQELIDHLLISFQNNENPVKVVYPHFEPLEVTADNALTCGLIYNELFTNSIKHAFTPAHKKRCVFVSLTCINGNVIFTVSDNGDNEKPLLERIEKSFGLRFVDQLVSTKLKGESSYQTENGFQVTITFEIVEGLRSTLK